MTRKINDNTAYEIFVQELHQQLLRATGLENIEVKHNVDLIGISGQPHQIDVYWEYRYAGITHRVALECKNYSSTISLGKIRDFHSVLMDVSGLQGIMVTRIGYQKGVIKIAKTYDIGLRLAREIEDSDFNGRIRGITMNLSAIFKDVENLNIILDEQWCVANLEEGDMNRLAESGLSGYPGSELIIKSNESMEEADFNDLFNRLPAFDLREGELHEYKYEFKNSFLFSPDFPPVKVLSVSFSYTVRTSEYSKIEAQSVAKNIIKDVLSGRLLFIDESGKISGDTDDF